ncbi:type ISP restriction/modification enzyme [Sulfitobacter sp.]|uniref:type ISP restriction/modification enzyme n=1 Tax=Sulfitobacter sp. TaxID=1903071 RepID=UPI00300194FF
MDIQGYFDTLIEVHSRNDATEHSYRPALQALFDQIATDTIAQNEPKQRKDVGAPDFAFHRGEVVIGWAEAKDLGHDIRKLKGYEKDQHARYVRGLDNLIYTDGLTFIFYRNGIERQEVRIGEHLMGFQSDPSQFEVLESALKDFATQTPISITSPEELAKRMAGKAILIKQYLGEALIKDKNDRTELSDQYNTFRELMIHDISISDFAGMYAETVAYGMFAARLNDPSPDTFTRQEALDLLPKSNPFLRNLFGYIAGPSLDDRLKPILDELAIVFKSCDVAKIMEKFGSTTGRRDPFIHFYETFLAEYDPKKRKARGVWYTPEPVVNFIVRAVDEILQTEFGLKDGLADISKVKVKMTTGQTLRTATGKLRKDGKTGIVTKEMHRVQILDPATGTGTFLAEAIKQIAPRIQNIAPGMWNSYVEEHLIPRLHGFELLMASYAMCHMKLDMMLSEMNYKPTENPPRLSVYLTNSLEEGEPLNATLPFQRWLSDEIRKSNEIKTETPIMCVIGNPPYSGVSQNNGEWITDLIEDYKYVGKEHFGERKHWLQDDYVKFIRMSEHLIEKNGHGVLGFITNHGYLDNPTFRGMRWHLLQTFDKIYVLDLHGNANKKELTQEGKPDKNVFDIRQGVSIIVAVKNHDAKENTNAKVYRGDIWGTRKEKNDALLRGVKELLGSKPITLHKPYYMFYEIDAQTLEAYDNGFSITEFMPMNQKGIISARDHLAIGFDKADLDDKISKFLDPDKSDDSVRNSMFPARKNSKYLRGDTRGWSVSEARTALRATNPEETFTTIDYRPFDRRQIAFTEDLVDWPRSEFMRQFADGKNLGLMFNRGIEEKRVFSDVFVASHIVQHHTLSLKEANNIAPLYVEETIDQTRRPNFDPQLHKKMVRLSTHTAYGEPSPEDIFDYIYAVLHCPAYRDTYAEFLKIDFPRIPWPSSPAKFWDMVPKGSELRRLHLMESSAIGDTTACVFDGSGDGVVDKPEHREGRVWVNATQSFAAVPEAAWNAYIGGYQPAQKWLKDRKGRTLSFEDIRHYQSIIKILTETNRIMSGIEMNLTASQS